MSKMRQDVGAETLCKNRSHTRSGLVRDFCKAFMPKRLRQIGHFYFGFRVEMTKPVLACKEIASSEASRCFQ